MKLQFSTTMRRGAAAVALCAAWAGCSKASRVAPPSSRAEVVVSNVTVAHLPAVGAYAVTTFGSFVCRGYGGGQLVGKTASDTVVLITQDGTVTDLGTPAATTSAIPGDVNGAGVVVATGYATVDGGNVARGGLYANGSWTTVGDLGGGATALTAVNSAGVVIGYGTQPHASGAFPDTTAFVVNMGTVTMLPGLQAGSTTATAISAGGAVAGSAEVGSGDNVATHAVVWWTPSAAADLGTLGGANSAATGINDGGTVVGMSETGSGQVHAFAFAGTMADLGVLPGDVDSVARAVNGSGTIVGGSRGTDGLEHPWVIASNGMISLLPSDENGRRFLNAIAETVDDDGTIVGWGTDASGTTRCLQWR